MKARIIVSLLFISLFVYGGIASAFTESDFVSPPTPNPANNYFGYEAGGSGINNSFFGHYAGDINAGDSNTFIGVEAGSYNDDGSSNIFIGSYAGTGNVYGDDNVFLGSDISALGFLEVGDSANTIIGSRAGFKLEGSNNTFLGYQSGYENVGSNNVFLGYQSGYYEHGSNKLYIDNSSTNTPLIYGEFDNDSVEINGTLKINTAPATTGLIVIGTVTAGKFFGDGSGLTNIPASAHVHSGADITSGTVLDAYIDPLIARDSEVTSAVDAHTTRSDNPHSLTAIQLGAADAVHNHDPNYVNVSGDTMNGDLLVNGIVDIDQDLYVVGNIYAESDVNSKKDIKPIESSLDKIISIQGVSYTWKDNKRKDRNTPDIRHYGVLAQQVEEVIPEIVTEGQNNKKKVAYLELIPLLIEAVEEQQQTISGLSEKVNELERKLQLRESMAMVDTDY